MAFPDWPLSHGSVNPHGWWEDFWQRLEHGHRLMAETVALLIGVLCAWTWQSRWSVPISALGSLVIALCVKQFGAGATVVAHAGLWSAALIFAGLILRKSRSTNLVHASSVRWLTFAAFIGVLGQALLGGLRVTIETAGDPAAATIFRVLHGAFAQIELCILVIIAALLSPAWRHLTPSGNLRGLSLLGAITGGAILLQLIVGASMRHLGAGLAISTWPEATAAGGWLPAVHNLFVDLNFAHTRIGAIVVSTLVVLFSVLSIRRSGGAPLIVRPAALLLVLLFVQFALGVSVIWNARAPGVTTLHVVNGAAVLALTTLLTLRLSGSARLARHSVTAGGPVLSFAEATS